MILNDLLNDIGDEKIKRLIKGGVMSSTVLMYREIFSSVSKKCDSGTKKLSAYEEVAGDLHMSEETVRRAVRTLKQTV